MRHRKLLAGALTAMMAITGLSLAGSSAAVAASDGDNNVEAPTKIFELPKGDIDAPTFGVGYNDGYGMDAPDVYVNSSMGRSFEWQVQQGDQWVPIAAVPGMREMNEAEGDGGFGATYENGTYINETLLDSDLPEGMYNFRLYSPPTAYDAEFISRTVPYSVQAYATFKDFRTKVSDMIKPYCPNALESGLDGVSVYANLPNQPGLDVNGVYSAGSIYMMENMTSASDDQLYQTAIHECAHFLQDKTAYANDKMSMGQLNEILLPIYGEIPNAEALGVEGGFRDGLERNAQCMAYLMGSSAQEHPYINRNECTGAREEAARAIIEGRLPG